MYTTILSTKKIKIHVLLASEMFLPDQTTADSYHVVEVKLKL